TAKQVGFYITSAGNTLRGLIISNIWRPIMLDTTSATGNSVIGNWLGFETNGSNSTTSDGYGVLLNNGASSNFIGTPALADRNVIGNFAKGIDSYGTGTNNNTIQNNVLCEGPSGFTTAVCNTAVDHEFGVKNELLGGTGGNNGNVMGATKNQGV